MQKTRTQYFEFRHFQKIVLKIYCLRWAIKFNDKCDVAFFKIKNANKVTVLKNQEKYFQHAHFKFLNIPHYPNQLQFLILAILDLQIMEKNCSFREKEKLRKKP